jgi:lipopolysaccharide/colanic/teichoic acid biosynthesis glycosyltransferase
MFKFRTMTNECDLNGVLLPDSQRLNAFGKWLRSSSLDELPELLNVLKGDMSLVGPRPCLFNQMELIEERASRGIFAARPGITGLAQVNGIDMSTPELLAQTDARMLRELGVRSYFKFIFLTVLGKGSGDRVKTK